MRLRHGLRPGLKPRSGVNLCPSPESSAPGRVANGKWLQYSRLSCVCPKMRKLYFLLIPLWVLNYMIFIRWLIEFVSNTLISIPHYFSCFCFCSVYQYPHHCLFNFGGFTVHKTCLNFYFSQGMFSDFLPLPCGTYSTLKLIQKHDIHLIFWDRAHSLGVKMGFQWSTCLYGNLHEASYMIWASVVEFNCYQVWVICVMKFLCFLMEFPNQSVLALWGLPLQIQTFVHGPMNGPLWLLKKSMRELSPTHSKNPQICFSHREL